ncbi:MAG: dihydroneopterin aldolase [Prevotella sp.]|jgi:dihydroneopterin aldolase|nr:dihydroneopterin aldolase [Prevotella sp.]
MHLTESYICLHEVRFYAFHGVMPQERRVGGEFLVSVKVGYPLEKAMSSDDVADTLNYAELYELVKKEMMLPSSLLEHVMGRIVEAIEKAFPKVTSVEVKIKKVNPPMGSDSNGAEVMGRFEK